MAGSWAGLGAQGAWGCCRGRGPVVARGGAQGRGGGRGAGGVAWRHSWGLRVLAAVDRLGAVFGWRLQVGGRRGSGQSGPQVSPASRTPLPGTRLHPRCWPCCPSLGTQMTPIRPHGFNLHLHAHNTRAFLACIQLAMSCVDIPTMSHRDLRHHLGVRETHPPDDRAVVGNTSMSSV